MKWIKQIFCRHKYKNQIIIHDWYYDFMTDNDDLEDIPTYIIISFCPNCGKIFSKRLYMSYKSDVVARLFGFEDPTSSYDEIAEFEKLTGVKIKDITMYKDN